jgi:hypothetical protein
MITLLFSFTLYGKKLSEVNSAQNGSCIYKLNEHCTNKCACQKMAIDIKKRSSTTHYSQGCSNGYLASSQTGENLISILMVFNSRIVLKSPHTKTIHLNKPTS